MPTNDSADIEFNIEGDQATRELKKQGKNLDKVADAAEKSSRRIAKGEGVKSQAIKSNAAVTATALRKIATAERRAELAGLKGTARLKAQEKQMLAMARASGVGKQGLDRITASFKKMTAAQSKAHSGNAKFGGGLISLTSRIGIVAIAVGTMIKLFKEYAVGSAIVSARNETLAAALAVVARNTGQDIGLIQKLEGRIQRMGLTLEASRTILARFSATRLPVERIEELVDLGRNLAVVMGTNTSEAVVRLTRAITNQEVEILRTAGLNIKFETGHIKMAKAIGITADKLTDAQKRLANFNIVMEQGSNFLGTYEAALGTTGKQLTSLPRLVENFKQALGVNLQPALDAAVKSLTAFLKLKTAALEGGTEERVTFERLQARLGRSNVSITGAPERILGFERPRGLTGIDAVDFQFALIKGIGTAVASIPKAIVDGLNTAILTGVRRKGFVSFQSLFEPGDELLSPINQQRIRDINARTREQVFGRFEVKAVGGRLLDSAFAESVKIKAREKAAVVIAERLKEAKKAEKEAKEAELRAAGLLFNQEKASLNIIQRIEKERRKILATTGKTAQAIRDINRAFDIERDLTINQGLSRRQLQFIGGRPDVAAAERGANVGRGTIGEEFTGGIAAFKVSASARARVATQRRAQQFDFAAENLAREKGLRQAGIISISKFDIAGKLSAERQKFDIEVVFVQRSIELQRQRIKSEVSLAVAGQVESQRETFRKRLEAQRAPELTQLDKREADALLLARRTLIRSQSELIISENDRVFNRLKRGAEDVFDSLLRSSQSFFKNLTNVFKTAILTGLREVISTQIASILAPAFGGSNQSSRGGLFGGLRLPGFGNRSPSSGVGQAAALATVLPGLGGFSFPGAPGGTTGFNGPVGGVGRGGFGSVSSGVGVASQLSQLGRLRELFGLGSSISTGAGSATTFGAASLGQKLGSFARSTGGALVGAGLAAHGIKRGGISGIAEAAGGGALLGFKFGGPLGAGIGAAIGGGIAAFRTIFFKGAIEKAKQKIKSAFGIDVNDKGFLGEIVNIAKQQFGGNIGVAIRSPVVLDLLELFAASTGQDFGSIGIKNLRFVAKQSGGEIFQVAQFRHGQAFASVSSLPTHNPTARAVTILQLNAEATRNVLQGQAVEAIRTNPREVQAASLDAQQGNFGRRQQAALGLQPNTVLA